VTLDNMLNISRGSQDSDRIRVYVCKFCGKACPSQWKLDRHMHTHTGERPFTCDLCDVTTPLPIMMTDQHFQAEKQLACETCGKVFKSNWALNRHGRESWYDIEDQSTSEHGRRQQSVTAGGRHYCNMCGKLFPSNWKLQRHMRVHTGEKPFVCSFCDKGFNVKSNLKVHIVAQHHHQL
ncbi:zinc finger protein 415-like, partial [Ruditapes philippinarum]|uniref:zinc finger protein 415-like n=1 Tax=Ruditapes philippinarum TaxID=129788 RepID=UPI00295B6A08